MRNNMFDNKEIEMEVERMDRLLKTFKTLLMVEKPFYGSCLVALDRISPNLSIKTACTNGISIYYNPMYTKTLNNAQVRMVIMHELFHILYLHNPRMRSRMRFKWNIACDYIVNYELSKLKFNDPKLSLERSDGIYLETDDGKLVNLDNYTAEMLYQLTTESISERSIILGDSSAASKSDNQTSNLKGELTIKEYEYKTVVDEVENKITSNEFEFSADMLPDDFGESSMSPEEYAYKVRVIIKNAIESEKKIGSGSTEEFDRFLKELDPPRIKWSKYLRRYFTSKMSEDVTYENPDKKYMPYDFIVPGNSEDEGLTDAWFFVDVSGSIDDDEYKSFISEAYHICKDFKCTMNIACWTDKICKVYENIENEDDIFKLDFGYCGGTNIECVFDYIKKRKIKNAPFIIVTDGYCGVGHNIPQWIRTSTIIAITTNVEEFPELRNNGKVVSFY